MTVPAIPPQPTADAESFASSQRLGSGLSSAAVPGKLRRNICKKRHTVTVKAGCSLTGVAVCPLGGAWRQRFALMVPMYG